MTLRCTVARSSSQVLALATTALRSPRSACTAGDAPAASQCCSVAQQRRCSPQSCALCRSVQRLRRRRRRRQPGNCGALVATVQLSASSCLLCTPLLWRAHRCTLQSLVLRARCCSTRTARLPPPNPATSSVKGTFANPRVLLAVAFVDVQLPSAVRDETERVLAEELAQRCARGYAHHICGRLRFAELRRAVPARSFRRLPEDEQVALVERLLRRAIASDASSRGVRTELQAAPPPRKRSDAEPSAESAVSRGAQQAQAAPADGLPAAAPSVEPTSVLDAQDGWDGAAPSDAPPLALELEKLLPSAPSRTLPATSRSPAAGTTPGTPAGVMVASQPVSDTLFSRGLTPLAAAVAAGAAAVLGVIAVWLKPGRAADATPQQTAPADDRSQAPPGLSARVATPGEVEAATTRRPEVLWYRKETPQADASAADADGAAPGVLWKRGAPRTKPVATEDAPTAAGDVKESVGAAELSDNAEGLRFGARLKQPPK